MFHRNRPYSCAALFATYSLHCLRNYLPFHTTLNLNGFVDITEQINIVHFNLITTSDCKYSESYKEPVLEKNIEHLR